ncbi:galactoside alpha-(1,2)-fucosyltransferase 2-like [Hyla sarda]|uniref:galactoside alpha-(1,2)-fucosyltransferase 2-like n=1 Tax=Hyla sarda TaxID=327740 RepID=UPI0024C43266|nr:galactoside alpha-(1,2)-fucosyltransferase 2-like [Hyla sarda]
MKKSFLIFIFTAFMVVMNVSYWYYNKSTRGMGFTICKAPGREKLDENASNNVRPLKGMMTILPQGRFGNQIGEYAALYALAKMNDYQAYLLPEMHQEFSSLFKLKLPVISKDADKRIKWKQYPLNNWMCPEYRNITGENVKLKGFVYSWTFYHHLKSELLEELTFHDFVKDEVNSYLAQVRGDRKNVTFVGVHVRRGDYEQLFVKQKRGVLADKNYLQKATDYFRNKYQNPIFVVTSNGMKWCKDNINNSLGDVYFAGDGNEGSPARDFAILAHCNHTIMTFGSFGIWAAYLAGGEAMHLTNYSAPDSSYLKYVKYEAIYLPEWIAVAADLSELIKSKAQSQN